MLNINIILFYNSLYMSCKYKDIFGKPSEGVHSIRLFNLAVVDIIMVIIGGLFIAHYFNYNKYEIKGTFVRNKNGLRSHNHALDLIHCYCALC